MNTFNFTMKRVYETFISIDASTYEEALAQLSDTDVFTLELEQCCVTDEVVINEQEEIIKDLNFIY